MSGSAKDQLGTIHNFCPVKNKGLNSCLFALKTNDTVEFRNEFQSLLITQTREVAAHGEVTGGSGLPQHRDELMEALDVKLEY